MGLTETQAYWAEFNRRLDNLDAKLDEFALHLGQHRGLHDTSRQEA